jgi:N-glycosylase/DNA lyase
MHRLSTYFSLPLLTLEDPVEGSRPVAGPSTIPASEAGITSTTYHLFPGPHLFPATLEQTLRDLGFGYRAGFLESSLATLRAEFGENEGDVERGLEGWRSGDVDVVREKLIGLKGVGRKVADCVMLMCLDQVSVALRCAPM